ncbi:MAG: hypothetical protein RL684_2669, partial [Pseudomonadota bacterium]
MRARRLPLALSIALACSRVLAADAGTDPGAAAGEAAESRFSILELRVLGNTVLKNRAIETAVYPFLGPNRTVKDVEAARTALELAYHEAGYATVFVDIPEQQVEGGLVRLQVTEGKVDRVRTQNTRYFSNRWIRESLPELQTGNVPRLPELQAELAALNARTPDLSVTPVLKAGRKPGTVDINLKVIDTLPLHESLEVNDRYTANTSRLRASGSVSYTNLFQLQHALSLQYQSSVQEPKEVRAIVASYSLPVRSVEGLSLAFYGVDSKSDVLAVGTLGVLGTGRIYGARAIYSPREAGATVLRTTTLGVDYKNFLEDINLAKNQSAKTPIKYVNWSFGESLAFLQPKYQLQLDATANFGVRGLPNETDNFLNKRYYGSPNYFDLHASTQYTRQLAGHLQGYLRLGGQYSRDALVSNEQYAIGGLDTVRGYTEAADLGDRGFSATLELRTNLLAKPLHVPDGLLHGFVFFDYGAISVVKPLPGQYTSFELASYGVGVRLLPWHGFSTDLEW